MAVDLDLSRLSGTVVYSQIYNMMSEPESYLGKVIRVAGYYSAYEDTERGVVYHACVIPDATACCAQGIEFIWGGKHQWPDDYQEDGTNIIVTGRLESYDEDGYEYLHLVDSEVIWLAKKKKQHSRNDGWSDHLTTVLYTISAPENRGGCFSY